MVCECMLKFKPNIKHEIFSFELPSRFVAQDQLDIAKVFSESHASAPIIFILGREVDPLKYIFRYAEDVGFPAGKLKIVTLGSGQEERAKEVIRQG